MLLRALILSSFIVPASFAQAPPSFKDMSPDEFKAQQMRAMSHSRKHTQGAANQLREAKKNDSYGLSGADLDGLNKKIREMRQRGGQLNGQSRDSR